MLLMTYDNHAAAAATKGTFSVYSLSNRRLKHPPSTASLALLGWLSTGSKKGWKSSTMPCYLLAMHLKGARAFVNHLSGLSDFSSVINTPGSQLFICSFGFHFSVLSFPPRDWTSASSASSLSMDFSSPVASRSKAATAIQWIPDSDRKTTAAFKQANRSGPTNLEANDASIPPAAPNNSTQAPQKRCQEAWARNKPPSLKQCQCAPSCAYLLWGSPWRFSPFYHDYSPTNLDTR